jgi:ribonuclease BN (tRNA processing enzyme)
MEVMGRPVIRLSVNATAGRIAKEAGVQTLVLSHLTAGIDGIQDETWRNLAAKQFKKKIVVARDLSVL